MDGCLGGGRGVEREKKKTRRAGGDRVTGVSDGVAETFSRFVFGREEQRRGDNGCSVIIKEIFTVIYLYYFVQLFHHKTVQQGENNTVTQTDAGK